MSVRTPRIPMFSTTDDLDANAHDSGGDLACPVCQTPLETHQPDPDMPERLLGCCPRCRAWTLVDLQCDGNIIMNTLSRTDSKILGKIMMKIDN